MIKYALATTLALPLFSPAYYGLLSESPTTIVAEQQAEESQVTKPVADVKPEPIAKPQPKTLDVIATFYVSDCDGCSGITKSGDDVRHTIYANGLRVIAVDPNVIPLRSIVRVTLADGTTFDAIASDTGGRIKGAIIDVLVASESEAYRLGRQQAKLTILK